MKLFPILPDLEADLHQIEQTIIERLHARPVVEQIVGPFVQKDSNNRHLATLVLLTAQLGQYDRERALYIASSIELIHTALEMHLSLVDASLFRRTSPAEWLGIQGDIALMVGDYLLTLAAAEMARDPDARIISYYSQSVMSFSAATLETTLASAPDEARTQYLDRLSRGPAILYAAAAKAGAVCAGLSQALVDIVGEYGLACGMALRLVDDSRTYQSGSAPVSIISLPLIYAAEAQGSQIPAQISPKQVLEDGGVTQTVAMAQQFQSQGLQALINLPETAGRTQLESFLNWAAQP